MKQFMKLDRRIRYAAGAMLVAVSLLLLGAGKMNEGMHQRSAELQQARVNCLNSAMQLQQAIAPEDRAEWKRLAMENPEICFRVSFYGMKNMEH